MERFRFTVETFSDSLLFAETKPLKRSKPNHMKASLNFRFITESDAHTFGGCATFVGGLRALVAEYAATSSTPAAVYVLGADDCGVAALHVCFLSDNGGDFLSEFRCVSPNYGESFPETPEEAKTLSWVRLF